MERRINGWVAEGLPVETREMATEDAKAAGAIAMFGEKYGDTVRVRGRQHDALPIVVISSWFRHRRLETGHHGSHSSSGISAAAALMFCVSSGL